MKQTRQFVGWSTDAVVDFYQSAMYETELTSLTFGQGTEVFFMVTWTETFSDEFPVKYFVEDCTVVDQD